MSDTALKKAKATRFQWGHVAAMALVGTVAAIATVSRTGAQARDGNSVTFHKDVEPILQRACQECHRPGSIAPMPLTEFKDVRPWARSIQNRVARREMPPWYIEKNVGVQHFKYDRGLSDREISTIAAWVDGGAIEGNPKDAPPTRVFTDDDRWTIGKPDLIVSLQKDVTIPAVGPDWWPTYEVDLGVVEDRYIQAVETKPSRSGQRVTHHAATSVTAPDGEEFSLNEYAVGKNGDMFADGSGLKIKANSKISFSMHYHSIGEELTDRTSIAFKFYPKGYVPARKLLRTKAGSTYMDLDIPAGQVSRTDGYTTLSKPTVLLSFQPHMHNRGTRLCMEAIYPDQRVETISCAKFNFEWMVNYIYDEREAPLLPAGTILHTIGWHDNTAANKYNPDPRNWAGFGNRSIDDMSFAWITMYNVSEAELTNMLDERKKAIVLGKSTY
jgi:hypothetical protein